MKASLASGVLEAGDLTSGEHLGAGGGGTVSKYSYLGLATELAGKHGFSADDEELRRESLLMASLPQHENLLNGMGTVETSTGPMALMEVADCGNVNEIIEVMQKDDEMKQEDKDLVMQYVMRSSLRGMEALHQAGIVHGDIKGHNIFIDAEVRPMLADFGTSDFDSITQGQGTADYNAPEVINGVGADGVTQAADVWALGEMMVKGMTGGMNSLEHLENQAIHEHIEYKKAASLINPEDYEPGQIDPRTRKLAGSDKQKDLDEAVTDALTYREGYLPRRAGLKDSDDIEDRTGPMVHFLEGFFRIDPSERITASQALQHPWMQMEEAQVDRAKELIGGMVAQVKAAKAAKTAAGAARLAARGGPV
ncbi:MAG: protein kinase [Proteobacteria bacterium]|nr:protein kinase [Pseudomonadota bacterium]